MGVDLVVTVPGRVDEQAKQWITDAMMSGYDAPAGWEPHWNEETDKDGNLWTYCFPGDRYIGCHESLVGCMNLNKLPRLLQIYAAFIAYVDFPNYREFGHGRSIYFLPDYDTPTQSDKGITFARIQELISIAKMKGNENG
jgi:hypothetical protein